jgi:selenoprotein W-related protein
LREAFATEVELVPGDGGIFDIAVDGKKIFSKAAMGRFPEDGEIARLIRQG